MHTPHRTTDRTQRAIHDTLGAAKLCVTNDSIGFEIRNSEAWPSVTFHKSHPCSFTISSAARPRERHRGVPTDRYNLAQSLHKLSDWDRKPVRPMVCQGFGILGLTYVPSRGISAGYYRGKIERGKLVRSRIRGRIADISCQAKVRFQLAIISAVGVAEGR